MPRIAPQHEVWQCSIVPSRQPRNRTVVIFLSSLPLWSAVILLVILPTCIAMCGPVILRRWIGHQRPGQQQRNRRLSNSPPSALSMP
ncbi:MAG: hypothetical protein WDN04_20385 [Rhodospirillales bacterium]